MKTALLFSTLLTFSVSASDKLNFEEPVRLKKTDFDIKKIYSNC